MKEDGGGGGWVGGCLAMAREDEAPPLPICDFLARRARSASALLERRVDMAREGWDGVGVARVKSCWSGRWCGEVEEGGKERQTARGAVGLRKQEGGGRGRDLWTWTTV